MGVQVVPPTSPGITRRRSKTRFERQRRTRGADSGRCQILAASLGIGCSTKVGRVSTYLGVVLIGKWKPIESAVLGLLAQGPAYGYEIARLLRAGGFGEVTGGTLYPLLRRLEDASFVTSSWRDSDDGPPRKYYEVTSAGREETARRKAQWEHIRRAVDDVFEVTS